MDRYRRQGRPFLGGESRSGEFMLGSSRAFLFSGGLAMLSCALFTSVALFSHSGQVLASARFCFCQLLFFAQTSLLFALEVG